MSADDIKSNRISDDSGVVCFNTLDDLQAAAIGAYTSLSTDYSSPSLLPPTSFNVFKTQKLLDSESSNSMFQYKSVYNRPTSIISSSNEVKRREKRNDYVIGGGGNVEGDEASKFGKYGTKRLTHVQQMRLRFENWSQISSEEAKCEAVNCKKVREERFESLPIIPFAKPIDKKANTSSIAVESPPASVDIGLSEKDFNKHPLSKITTPPLDDCQCDDDDIDNEEESLIRESGSSPVSGEKIGQEENNNGNSDFEEDSQPHDQLFGEPLICEIKNTELCDTLEEDDFEEVTLEDSEEVLVTDEFDPNTKPDSLNKTFTNLLNIVDELLSCEQTYIQSLEIGVKDYKSIFRDPEVMRTLPDILRGQDGVIFGNIDRICDFHRDELLPKLLDCDLNVTRICEVFCDLIQRDFFYKYVLYAMNRTKSENICGRSTDFFRRRQEQIGDRLGLNSFLVKPIQRLPHYKMLFNQMIVELLKNMEDESLKPLIAICCKTEKYVQKLLDTVNESMHINDIEECYEFNILHQGKFRKMDSFDIYEKYSNYRYKGRLFLFEKSLVYTEQTSKNRLVYKGHFMKTKIGLEPDRTSVHSTSKQKLILFSEKLGQQCIEVSSDTPVIYEWKAMIDDIIRSFIVEERERVKRGKRPNRTTSARGTPIKPELRSNTRGSIYSIKSLASDIGSLSSETGSDKSSKISVDSRLGPLTTEAENRRTTWYAEL